MKRCAALIEQKLENFRCNELIVASGLYKSMNGSISEQTFYKTISRMAECGKLVHLTSGIYYKPKETKFGRIPISDNDISEHYLNGGQGILIGYKLYNRHEITTQIGKKTEILSSSVAEQRKNIRNVSVERINIHLDEDIISAIEALEILQGCNNGSIQDMNTAALINFLVNYSQNYSEEAVEAVLAVRRYKKSTIAFLNSALNHLHVNNSLDRHLSSLSKYNIPDMEDLYEASLRKRGL